MKVSDIVSICTAIAGLASAISAPALELVFPGHGTYIAGVLALTGIVATVVIRTLTNKAGAPATSIVANAPMVPPATIVTAPSTPTVGTVVSTTSTDAIIAPQKAEPL
jgi:hypothetical protein